MSSLSDNRPRPLLLTGDDSLLDDLLRLSAAAGVTPEVARDVGAARHAWGTASVVVVGDDLSRDVTAIDAPRRDGIVVVTTLAEDSSVWVRAVGVGAEHVLVLPRQQDTLIELFGACADGGARTAVAISVIGGCGGAGASVFATALSLTAADRRLRTLLVDTDPLGGGIDMVLGTEDAAGLRWSDLASASGRLGAGSLREALPSMGSLSMLAWDRADLPPVSVEAMRSVLSAGQRGHDLVVIDCPRRLDPAAEEAVTRSTLTLVVLPAEVRAIAAATRVLAQLRSVTTQISLVVRGPGPSGLDGQLVAESLQVPLLAQMRPERGLAASLDEGLGPVQRRRGPLVGCCSDLLSSLSVLGGVPS